MRGGRRALAAVLRPARLVLGVLVLGWAVSYLADVGRGPELGRVAGAVLGDPIGLASALTAYAAAFGLRTWAWRRVLPGLSVGHAWAALHVSLVGNHVLPLRMGEVLRPVSVARRTDIGLAPAAASVVTLRAVDLLAVLGLALLVSPALVLGAAGGPFGLVVIGAALGGLLVAGVAWTRRHAGAARIPDTSVVVAAVLAWALEAAVVWEVARVAGIGLSPWEAVGVTAVTIAAQVVAVTPGGFGTYEAAATAAMVGVGHRPRRRVRGRPDDARAEDVLRPRGRRGRAVRAGTRVLGTAPAGPVPASAPARPRRPPRRTDRRDHPGVRRGRTRSGGSSPASPARCRAARWTCSSSTTARPTTRPLSPRSPAQRSSPQPRNLGLGAAVRRGLAEASARAPAAVVYLDADGEYFPEDIPRVVAPVLDGSADYVVGSRFAATSGGC